MSSGLDSFLFTPEHTTPETLPPDVRSTSKPDITPPNANYARRAPASAQLRMPSLGILDPLMRDETISDILISGTDAIYIDRQGVLIDSGLRFESHEAVWQIAEQIMEASNQLWSADCPMIDARLPDGSRVNLVGPPIAIDGVSVSIRKFPQQQLTLDSMAAKGQITPELSIFLKECVRQRLNIIIAGGTSGGKTTFLNALSAAISHDERVVTIEDSAELRLQRPHVVRLEAKSSQRDGEKDGRKTTMRSLIKNALRMRPDRIIVGESRGAEAFDVLQAMNTGHAGSMTTLHANSPRDALARLETMVMIALPNLSLRMIRQQIASSVNLVIQIARTAEGLRHVSTISEVCGMEGDTFVMQDLMTFGDVAKRGTPEYRWNNNSPRNPLVSEAARTAGIMKALL